MSIVRAIVDLLFPPLCATCGNRLCHSQLCDICWEASRIVDPSHRCIHCFASSETSLCGQCSEKPAMPYPRAVVFEREAPILHLIDEESAEAAEAWAGFAFVQLQQLGWPEPDFLVSVVPSPIAKSLAVLCNKASSNFFRRRFSLGKAEKWELREGLISEDAIIVLFDPGCKPKELENACAAISEAFPKKVYILSLHEMNRRIS